MRIEKFVHSCLRLTVDGEHLLFDPGKFSFIDGRVDPAIFSDVSTVVLTLDHPDHIDKDALGAIIRASGATVIGNAGVAKALEDTGLAVKVVETGVHVFGAFRIEAQPVKHQPILSDETPQVTAFLVNDVFLNPGDSFDPRLNRFAGVEVLALPVMAPFLTELDVFEFARRLSPTRIIPVHDGYARDWFLKQRYDVYAPYLTASGIKLERLVRVGDAVDVTG